MAHAILAEFDTPEGMLAAVDALSRGGYRGLETYSPFPVPGAAEALELPRSRLPRYVFGGGALGALLGYGIQWYADVWDFPLRVGGRPLHPVPAFVPATFEAAMLVAALTAFAGLLLTLRLPRLWHSVFEIEGFERATIDRFWVAIEEASAAPDRGHATRLLEACHPLRVVSLEVP